MAPITNVNDKPIFIVKQEALKSWSQQEKENCLIYPYEKAICQGVLLVMPQLESKEISYEKLQEIASLRKTGKLGSSGK